MQGRGGVWERHGALRSGGAVVDGRRRGLRMAGLQGRDLGLLLADHVEQAVDLAFLLVLELLVQLSHAWGALVVRALRRAPATGGRAALHLAGRGHGGVVEVQVHSNARSTARALHFSSHATRRGSPRLLVLDACVHGRRGC
jgi:hypothetical protein